jgi:hypothetical protein
MTSASYKYRRFRRTYCLHHQSEKKRVAARHNVPEDSILYSHCSRSLRSYTLMPNLEWVELYAHSLYFFMRWGFTTRRETPRLQWVGTAVCLCSCSSTRKFGRVLYGIPFRDRLFKRYKDMHTTVPEVNDGGYFLNCRNIMYYWFVNLAQKFIYRKGLELVFH